MERRTFVATASLSPLFAPLVAAQGNSTSVEAAEIDIAGNKIFVRRYGQGPGILLVHGFPRTSLMWRFLAPKLSHTHTVVCPDLRAYGRSGTPLLLTTIFRIPSAPSRRNWLR